MSQWDVGMTSEYRSELRLERHELIYIEVISASFDMDDSASIVISSTVDISANGLQVNMDQPLPVGSILRLCVQPRDSGQRIHLVGEVMWVKPQDDDRKQFRAGFALYESDGTDILAWKQHITQWLVD